MKTTVVDRASLCNVVLLGLFACGLGLSLLLVRSRTAIALSDPLELAGEGISVSIPVGAGWKSLTEWTYERDNSFTLVSVYSVQGPPLAEVRWQYRLAEKPRSAEVMLRDYAERFAGQAGEIQRFEAALSFSWMHLFPRTGNEELLLAVAVPEDGRALFLQLRSYAEPLYIRDLFERLASGVQVHADPRKEAGKKLAADLAGRFYSAWLKEASGHPPAFLISMANGKPFGYFRASVMEPDSSEPSHSGFEYEETLQGSTDAGKTTGRFRAAEDLSEFVWTSARILRRRVNQSLLRFGTDGALEIRDSYGRSDTVWPAPGAVPEVLLFALARLMLEADQPEGIVDVIASAGWIVPAAVSKMNPAAVSEKMDQARYAVKVDFLHDADNFEEYYFDSQRILIGKAEHLPGQSPRMWKRATQEDILFRFGDLFEKPEKSAMQTTSFESYVSFRTNQRFQ